MTTIWTRDEHIVGPIRSSGAHYSIGPFSLDPIIIPQVTNKPPKQTPKQEKRLTTKTRTRKTK